MALRMESLGSGSDLPGSRLTVVDPSLHDGHCDRMTAMVSGAVGSADGTEDREGGRKGRGGTGGSQTDLTRGVGDHQCLHQCSAIFAFAIIDRATRILQSTE
jgi:hypothetical protein